MKDNSWEQFGKQDPYYAVITDARYKSRNLNSDGLKDFFKSGEDHVSEVNLKLQKYFKIPVAHSFSKVLDFGCGTGRLLLPFARQSAQVVGIDISGPMLEEAQRNLDKHNIKNVRLINSEDITKLNFEESFDFVHSFIVLQHIPQTMGYKIIDKLIELVNKGGYGMIHFTYANQNSSFRNKVNSLKQRYSGFRAISNIISGHSINKPLMQMNSYELPVVFKSLMQSNLEHVALDFTDHGGFLGVCIYFKK